MTARRRVIENIYNDVSLPPGLYMETGVWRRMQQLPADMKLHRIFGRNGFIRLLYIIYICIHLIYVFLF